MPAKIAAVLSVTSGLCFDSWTSAEATDMGILSQWVPIYESSMRELGANMDYPQMVRDRTTRVLASADGGRLLSGAENEP
ncbi:hypothetical protein B0T18DRAFT_65510 [Schizothecium vesticola]|uniref:Uncharacterized protein n=1 Tax=Schizothecium vesticola TaxID=314040 RepID=A0AA40KAB0_9PEZI|nr:hypothetical protein B0T18DRAFT_65510 [Schizothecium vesticola]